MALSYNLAYQETILVHPMRRQIFADKSDFLEHMRPCYNKILIVELDLRPCHIYKKHIPQNELRLASPIGSM